MKHFHARNAGEILREVGYAKEIITSVQELNIKKNFPADPDSRVLEDALCLVFLQHQFADLAARTAEDKVINALRKSWNKMTRRAGRSAETILRSARTIASEWSARRVAVMGAARSPCCGRG